MVRLDRVCQEEKITEIDVLWVDVQGTELLVLEGMGAMLEKTRFVAIEVGVGELYKGGASLGDVHTFFVQRGFLCIAAYCHDPFPLMEMIEIGSGELDLIYVNKAYVNL